PYYKAHAWLDRGPIYPITSRRGLTGRVFETHAKRNSEPTVRTPRVLSEDRKISHLLTSLSGRIPANHFAASALNQDLLYCTQRVPAIRDIASFKRGTEDHALTAKRSIMDHLKL